MKEKIKPKISVSGCLLGEEIRYNGQHKRHPHVVHEFQEHFEVQSFCPELAMGLGVPRPAIRLVKKSGEIRLVDSKDSSIDHTDLAYKTFTKIISPFKNSSGIILTSSSPSCSPDPVKVYHPKTGVPGPTHLGLFAKFVKENFPLIPTIASGRLYDNHLRDTFRTQVLTHYNFHQRKKIPKELINFHETHKFYIQQFGAKHLKELGRTCAGVNSKNFSEKYETYREYLFSVVFKAKISDKKRMDVAQHLAGFFKKELSTSDKKYLHDNIAAFKKQRLSFESILLLLSFLAKTYNQKYLLDQKIFSYYSKV